MRIRALLAVVAVAAFAPAAHAATLPPGNAAQQWDKIAEDTVVGSGAFQGEGWLYLGYVSSAMDGAVNPGERNGQSADAAVPQAAYDVLIHYFPAQAANLDALHDAALAAVPDSAAKRNGIRFGDHAAAKLLRERADDGLVTPIASSSAFATLPFGPGVWRLTPSAYAAPQTPWVADVRPFVLRSGDQFMPPPPPSLQSSEWVDAFREVKDYGGATGSLRNADQTATALFWAANTNRQYNGMARTLATRLSLDVPETARLLAMVNVVAADASIAFMTAKYRYLFWRPVTAIDPMSARSDGFGLVPGPDDGNLLTVEQIGWRPLLPTPNHPEYPSAHSTVTAAIMAALTDFLGTDQIDVDIQGNAALNVTRHYATADELLTDVRNGRIWAGLHYRFSTNAGAALGTAIGEYDVTHGFSSGG